MTDDETRDLAHRLVRGRDRGGRKIFDESAKAEVVALCRRPGVSISAIARQIDVGANQLRRWVKVEDDHGRQPGGMSAGKPAMARSFIEVDVAAPMPAPRPRPTLAQTQTSRPAGQANMAMTLGARLPNGVMLDIGAYDAAQMADIIEMLGRVGCSASMQG